jgi:RNA polymerase sigma-70 factor (ECF subfamily)
MKTAIALTEASKRLPWAAAQQSVDVVLLDRIADGDKLAMQALFARHNVSVYRCVLHLVDDKALVEDIVIEVFVDVWRNAKRFASNSLVSTWIMSIARLKAISSLRRRKDEMVDGGIAAATPDTPDDPKIAAQKKVRPAMLRECTSHLLRDH